jgi:hypothetical protein
VTFTFPCITHCESCGNRLNPRTDVTHASLCWPCHKAAKDFARDLGPEHDHESEAQHG